MSWLGEQKRRIGNLAHRRRWRRELDLEMALHRELRGEPRKFGNELLLRERSQAMWGWTWLETWGQDVRHGLRLLARTPLVTALALLSLTLGIGANTALFSLMDVVLLRPLPVVHAEQLVRVEVHMPGQSADPYPAVSNSMWEALRGPTDAFSAMLAWSDFSFTLGARSDESVPGALASGSYFATLGVQAERGRFFGAADDVRGCPAVADISDAFWRGHYGASPAAVGSTLELGGHLFTVIGVMAPGFFGTEVGRRDDIITPLCTEPMLRTQSVLGERNSWWLEVMGRLRPQASPAAASAGLAATRSGWEGALPSDLHGGERQQFHFIILPGAQGASFLRAAYGPALKVLLAVAGFVLLVACANLAGLMLARASARRQEIAVRLALGASRARMVRQLLTESLLLATGGAALGTGFAIWACAAITAFFSYPQAPVHLALAPDWRVLTFTVSSTLVAAALIGWLPGLAATRHASAPRPASAPLPLAHGWVITLQLALTLVLLAGAGLFLRSFALLTGTGKGFDTSGIVLASAVADPGHPLPDALVDGLGALPGIDAVSTSLVVPAQGSSMAARFKPLGGGASAHVLSPMANWVAPGFFATLRTPLVRGRGFRPRDNRNAPPVAIVNETLARQLAPGGDALGRFIEPLNFQGPPGPATEIIGVVADAKYSRLSAQSPPTIYFAMAQLPHQVRAATFYLRSELPAAVVTSEARGAFARVAPNAKLQLQTFDGLMEDAVKPQYLLATLAEWFGGLALLLAAIGLYGALAYEAARRRREFGIRVALGARPHNVSAMVLRQAATRTAVGAAAGITLAAVAARATQATLDKLLYGVRASDLPTLAGAAALLAVMALLAACFPARRAARADPMVALREE